MKTALACTGVVWLCATIPATELHVAKTGSDNNPGTKAKPLLTIQRAAERAQAGDTITVHAGTYRERVNPPRGGESERKRIVYRAAPGEIVEVKGSEVITNWVKVQDQVWKATLPNSFFGRFNPYRELIHGDWFDPKKRPHHPGAVYEKGEWLAEAVKLEEVLQSLGPTPLWFGEVNDDVTTIWAQFRTSNPNEDEIEINTRQTVFYPDRPGRDYLTVRGFRLRHAATPWAPPTAEQVGLIGTHWSKGWIIENNVVSHSACSGIALGKYGDEWDNTSANTAEGYVKTIDRALKNGWNKETIGHHIVRSNVIYCCEQTGIVGSLGAAFSTVTGNAIHDIHVRRLFSGAEMAGIKFHAAIDTYIAGNRIYRTCRGLWLDWMAQGTRVSGNLFQENAAEDIFVEVDHGPFVVDNNVLLSGVSLLDMSEGGAYVHNLFKGKIVSHPEPNRSTPFHPAHATVVAGLSTIRGGDDRFYNNIFVGDGQGGKAKRQQNNDPHQEAGLGLWVYDRRELPVQTGGNVYFPGARPYARESTDRIEAAAGLNLKAIEEEDRVFLELHLPNDLKQTERILVTTTVLGKATVPGLPYEKADGSPIRIDRDYFGRKRHVQFPGPFESPGTGHVRLRIW